jgi:protein phosphatase
LPTEIISSDACRGLVSDDETSLDATDDAFEVVHFLARKRLSRQKLTVVDATNVQPQARKSLLALAREHDSMPVAIVLDLPPKLCHERNQARAERQFGFHVVRQHASQLRQSLRDLRREGFRYVTVLDSLEAIEHGFGRTVATTTDPSTSLATYTAASTSSSIFCARSATRSTSKA